MEIKRGGVGHMFDEYHYGPGMWVLIAMSLLI